MSHSTYARSDRSTSWRRSRDVLDSPKELRERYVSTTAKSGRTDLSTAFLVVEPRGLSVEPRLRLGYANYTAGSSARHGHRQGPPPSASRSRDPHRPNSPITNGPGRAIIRAEQLRLSSDRDDGTVIGKVTCTDYVGHDVGVDVTITTADGDLCPIDKAPDDFRRSQARGDRTRPAADRNVVAKRPPLALHQHQRDGTRAGTLSSPGQASCGGRLAGCGEGLDVGERHNPRHEQPGCSRARCSRPGSSTGARRRIMQG